MCVWISVCVCVRLKTTVELYILPLFLLFRVVRTHKHTPSSSVSRGLCVSVCHTVKFNSNFPIYHFNFAFSHIFIIYCIECWRHGLLCDKLVYVYCVCVVCIWWLLHCFCGENPVCVCANVHVCVCLCKWESEQSLIHPCRHICTIPNTIFALHSFYAALFFSLSLARQSR